MRTTLSKSEHRGLKSHFRVISGIVFSFTLSLAAILLLTGCSKRAPVPIGANGLSKLSVFVSLPPQAFLVKRIGAEQADVKVLVAPGASPHTFEVTPRQLKEIARAEVFFTIGMPFEKALIEKITGQAKQAKVVDMTLDLQWRVLEFEDERHHDGEEHTSEKAMHREERDPHVWLGIPQLIQMALNTQRALSELDSAHDSLFNANLQTLLRELSALDARLKADFSDYSGQEFLVHHPAFGYFADCYNLRQLPLEIEGKSPSPRDIAEIINKAHQRHIKIIFVQPQFDPKTAQTVADAIGGSVVPIDPLAEDLLGNLTDISSKLRASLAKQGKP